MNWALSIHCKTCKYCENGSECVHPYWIYCELNSLWTPRKKEDTTDA